MRRLMLLVIVVLAGCFPYHYEWVPEVSGRVVDQHGNSVAGLWVGVVETDSLTKKEQVTASTKTDKEGRFLFPPNTGWGVYLVPQEPYFPYRYRLEIRSGEQSLYSSPLVDFKNNIRPGSWQNVEIRLQLRD